MAYDETTFRRQTDDQGDEPAAHRANGHSTGAVVTGAPHDFRSHRRDADSADPARADDGGRDRLGIHLGWEVVLLLGVAAIGYLLFRLDPAAMRRPGLDALLLSATVIGLLSLGAGLTLRACVPNLALGPIALAAALHYAENGDRGTIAAALPALVIAAGGSLVVAVLIVGLHVPAWAATLGAGMGVVVYVQMRPGPVTVQGAYDPADQSMLFFGAFAVLALAGGALGAVRPIRRMLGRMRPVGDPVRRRGTAAVLPVLLSLIVSSVFAVVAGFLLAAGSNDPVQPGTGLEWTGLALGVALLAGTSAYGRRGGIFGTLLAATGVALFLDYADRRNLEISLFAVAAATIGAGLLITRLVETFGKPLPVPATDVDFTPAPAGASPDLPENWSPSVPAQGRSDRWDDGPWGSTR